MYGLRFRGALDPTTQAELEGLVATLQEFLLTEHNEDGTHRPTESGLDFVPVGFIGPWSTDTAPTGWLLCDGRPVSRVTYRQLFKVIGSTYGVGDGVLTFNLPDLRGRFPLGKAATGTGSTLGATGGSLDHTHEIAADGSHNHGGVTTGDADHDHLIDNDQSTTAGGSSVEVMAGTGASAAEAGHQHVVFAATFVDGDHTHTIETQANHNHDGETGDANPPFLSLNYIILAGVTARG
jgi:microcystin-dependent protein